MTDNQTVDEKIQIKQNDCKKEIFNADNPIKDKKDDILGRIRFAENMSLRLLSYKADESVIIGLNGEWGSGKSSVINLIKQCINNNNDNAGKPAIIDFNPWMFSKREDITRYFFDEISSAFDYKSRSEEDKATAEKLRNYAKLLGPLEYVPELLGALEYVPYYPVFFLFKFLKNTNIFKKICEKYFRKSENVSIMGIKNELNDRLIKNKRNTIVFIDDIDRLTNKEIREIFRLVRVNADFGRMIYVIAFDRHIVEKSFEEQGKEYLEKIIQVNVNVPFPSKEGLSQFLCRELDRVIKTLPASAQEYFNKDENENNWDSVYRSGFRDFFKNIRDIKRFISGLEFNISRMCKNNVIEINPIDFIVVEAIRMFAYDFYLFMAENSVLFTAKHKLEFERLGLSKEKIKEEIENALTNCITEDNKCRQTVKGLVKELFPWLKDIEEGISREYNDVIWSKQLRVCSERFYDSYFNFIPGGDEGEISRYEITKILKEMDSMKTFERTLRHYIEIKGIGKILARIQDFTGDENYISRENAKNVIGALFNIYEDLPGILSPISESINKMLDSYPKDSAQFIMNQLLNRETDKEKNFNLLKELIPQTKGLSMQFDKTRTQTPNSFQIPPDKIIFLQKICVEKINNADKKYLINHKDLRFLLYKWKEWGGSKQLTEFINQVLESNKNTIVLVSRFISVSEEIEPRNGEIERIKKLQYLYKELSDFVNLEDIKTKLDEIKKFYPKLYEEHRNTIDLFLKGYEKSFV